MDGLTTSKAKVVIDADALPFEAQGSILGVVVASPSNASADAVLAANANIAAAFGAAPTIFAIGEVGGAYAKSGGTGSLTSTTTFALTVDLTKLASRADLVAGFYDSLVVGYGFASLTFTLKGDGATLISQTFTTAAAAQAFFTDEAIDLGSLISGPLSGNTLTLQATFSITTNTPGSGFYSQFIIGDPPPTAPAPASASRFVAAMVTLGGGATALVSGAGVSADRLTPALANHRSLA